MAESYIKAAFRYVVAELLEQPQREKAAYDLLGYEPYSTMLTLEAARTAIPFAELEERRSVGLCLIIRTMRTVARLKPGSFGRDAMLDELRAKRDGFVKELSPTEPSDVLALYKRLVRDEYIAMIPKLAPLLAAKDPVAAMEYYEDLAFSGHTPEERAVGFTGMMRLVDAVATVYRPSAFEVLRKTAAYGNIFNQNRANDKLCHLCGDSYNGTWPTDEFVAATPRPRNAPRFSFIARCKPWDVATPG